MLVEKEATAGLERRSQPVSKNQGRRELFLRKLVQNEMRPGISNEGCSLRAIGILCQGHSLSISPLPGILRSLIA